MHAGTGEKEREGERRVMIGGVPNTREQQRLAFLLVIYRPICIILTTRSLVEDTHNKLDVHVDRVF